VKRNVKGLLYLLQKHEVKLDVNGDPDFSKVKDKNVVASLSRH
jgi:hypothetical protein